MTSRGYVSLGEIGAIMRHAHEIGTAMDSPLPPQRFEDRRKSLAEIRVNKVDAARRQIDTAIRLLFSGEDPASVHTLASAGGRIVRDLCEQKKTPMTEMFNALIIPGMEKEFWSAMNRAANFFKHADNDGDEILDGIDERANDLSLFLACLYYRDLGCSLTIEMRTLVNFVAIMHPNFVQHDAIDMKRLNEMAGWLKNASRPEQLKFLSDALDFARQAGLH